jgi:urocanate hydratase
MALEPLSPAAFAFIARIEAVHARLLNSAQPEPGLGGKLLYAGNLDEPGRAFTIAASMAGGAALAACADPLAAKQAMRSAEIDFLVNSLDEALRVLKNQLRKREPVAVCVSLAAAAVEAEMRARGVVPDFSLREDFRGQHAQASGARAQAADEQQKAPLEPAETASRPATWPRAAGSTAPRAISAAWRRMRTPCTPARNLLSSSPRRSKSRARTL